MKNNNGITLITLVLTIIILLILASVGIAMLTGENGILSKAVSAKQANEKAIAEEEIKLVISEWKMEKITNREKEITEFLSEKVVADKIDDYNADAEKNEYEIIRKGYSIIIDKEGNIKQEIQKTGNIINVKNLKITLIDGEEIQQGEQVHEGTALIINFEANMPNAEVEISPELPHKTTEEEMANKQVTFTIKEKGGEQSKIYTVSLNNIYTNTSVWTQNGTTVTNKSKNIKGEDITLKVGQSITGYTANNVGNGNWYVLGAKDEKLLLTTAVNQGKVTLRGQDGYENAIKHLNEAAIPYKNEDLAEEVRSINVEDINRVTGYDPDVAQYNSGSDLVNQWANEVTYTLNSDGKVHYKGTKYPKSDTTSNVTSFSYWNGNNWETITSGKSITITSNHYNYYPQTLSDTSSSETKVNGSTDAYNLLFANTVGNYLDDYWLSSQFVETSNGYILHMVGCVWGKQVCGVNLYGLPDVSIEYSMGCRPVVSLKSNVKINGDGKISL